MFPPFTSTSCLIFNTFFLILSHYNYPKINSNFRESNEDDNNLAIPYYKMARITPIEVLKRVKKVQEQSGNHVSE